MNVAIDFELAQQHPKIVKALYEALSDKRHNVHFLVSHVCSDPKSIHPEVITSEHRQKLHELGLYCVGFVGACIGANNVEADAAKAAYCKNGNINMVIGSGGKMHWVLPDALVLQVAECA